MNSGETGFDSNPSEAVQTSAGALLKAARERSGLHIAALAVMLKVPVKKLEALETSRFDLLPDMVFARALASSVCRTLKIDAVPILDLLPQTGATQLAYRSSAVNAPFRSPNDAVGPSVWSRLPKPAFVAVALLLLASLLVAFLPALTVQINQVSSLVKAQFNGGSASKLSAAAAKDSAGGAVDLKSEKVLSDIPAVLPGATVSSSTLSGVLAGNSVGSGVGNGAGSAVGNVPGNAVAFPATTQDALPGSSAAAPATGIVVFRAVGESWVEVVDAKRQTVLRRTLAIGEAVGVSGVLPLSVTVGRANMTQVEVRGQAFDLAPWSKDNVARFEVK